MKHANKTIVIVDLRSIEYTIVDNCKYTGLTDTRQIQARTTQAFIYLLSGVWLHQLHSESFNFLFVGDIKPYWRHYELDKVGCNYKGNRNKDSKRAEILGHVHTQFQYLLNKNSIPLLQHTFYNKDGVTVGFEADDLAASFLKLHSKECKHCYVLTTDTDWLPFTSLRNVTWLGISQTEKIRSDGSSNYAPRVRTEVEALKWWQLNREHNSSKAKRNFPKTKIIDLWKFKAEFGDKSDNIPGNAKEKVILKYEPYVDLWSPPKDYDATKRVIFPAFVSKEFKPMSLKMYTKNVNFQLFKPFNVPVRAIAS